MVKPAASLDSTGDGKEPPMKLIKLELSESSMDDNHIDITGDRSYEKNHSIVASTNAIIGPGLAPSLLPPATSPASEPKYCNICDIKFNYLNTFIAHKKFYCKTSKPDLDKSVAVNSASGGGTAAPQSTVTVARAVTETSVL